MPFDARMILLGAAVAFTLSGLAHAADAGRLGIGHAATPAEIAGWDIDVRADGQGLPAGHGSVREGEAIYAQACAGCHGAKGEGKPADPLAGGFGTLATATPVRTVGSYWPYATTLFDFIRRAMPFTAPRSLTDQEVYALVAYLLAANKLIGEDDEMNATTLPKVRMPNRDNFVVQFPDRI